MAASSPHPEPKPITHPEPSLPQQNSDDSTTPLLSNEAIDPNSSSQLAFDLLGAFLDHRDLSGVGNFLRRGAMVGILLWVFNITVFHLLAPAESFELLEGMELNACIMVFLILFVTNGSRFGPLLLERDEVPIKESGILFGCCAVQGIALTSLSLLILFPTPVLIEPVTGNRVHLTRWAEWISLAFIMTFLTEGIDIPIQEAEKLSQHEEGSENWVGSSATRTAWWHASAIALSTAAGPLFAFAPDLNSWMIICFVSCVLFCSIYVRVFLRWRRLVRAKRGSTVDSMEAYDRCRLSLRLMMCCCVAWTFLVGALMWLWLAQIIYPPDSFWRGEAVFLMTESFFECLSKVWYLMVILHINEAVFDEPMRAVRRLEALRNMMSAVWDNSSDVVILCLPNAATGHIKAIVSPAFSKLEDFDSENGNTLGKFAVVLEVEPGSTNGVPIHRAFTVDLKKPITRDDARRIRKSLHEQVSNNSHGEQLTVRKKNIAALAKLIVKATSSDVDGQGSLLMHDLLARGSDGREHLVRCEAKITKLETKAVLVVLRDISERFQRFEAEKRLIQEITERKKDAEANRFTRHEVKNGLLAAIALLESIQGTIRNGVNAEEVVPNPDEAVIEAVVEAAPAVEDPIEVEGSNAELENTCAELDITLNEILDTILDEAMSRDVVHERYELNQQRITVSQILAPMRRQSLASRHRFPFFLDPDPFPEIIMDPRLLRYIHRNAVSNACRYGKPGGVVTTRIILQGDWLQLEVVNLPGDKHDKLVELSEETAARVFLPGTQLHREINASADEGALHLKFPSAGDGAWIMQKCAKNLGGKCTIRFDPTQTVFTMRCPAIAHMGKGQIQRSQDTKSFALPETTFGIVIDDSGIQRKLMDRFLALLGINKVKRRILGKDAEEIVGFGPFLEQMVRENPEAQFLVIVDENLDIVDGVRHQTVSGSQLISQVRDNLSSSEESRMLALVRSANDSAEDVALYKSRAHGFIYKAPLKNDGVLQMIEPLWKERFPLHQVKETGAEVSQNSVNDEELAIAPTAEDLMKTIEAIDALCLVMRSMEAIDALCMGGAKEASLDGMWPTVREELHKLKGDLKTLSSSPRMETILEAFDDMKTKNSPEELSERWRLVRSLILSVM
jgi:signal transduction histidine kinase